MNFQTVHATIYESGIPVPNEEIADIIQKETFFSNKSTTEMGSTFHYFLSSKAHSQRLPDAALTAYTLPSVHTGK